MEKGLIGEGVDRHQDKDASLSYLCACVLAFVLGLVFSVGCFCVKSGDVTALQLRTRINPNDAPVESLIRLPQIGVSRARRIVGYRQEHAGDLPVFSCCDDLKKVNGIGPAIAEQLSDYVRFE